ncbi:MAG: hypothetical protein O3A21_10010, partial [Proteobacteria bacterium]|nr:hypothetical protein [Pseudomonadota bacterium]
MREPTTRPRPRTPKTALFLAFAALLALAGCDSFGGDISGERLARVEASPQYRGGGFVNTVPQAGATFG